MVSTSFVSRRQFICRVFCKFSAPPEPGVMLAMSWPLAPGLGLSEHRRPPGLATCSVVWLPGSEKFESSTWETASRESLGLTGEIVCGSDAVQGCTLLFSGRVVPPRAPWLNIRQPMTTVRVLLSLCPPGPRPAARRLRLTSPLMSPGLTPSSKSASTPEVLVVTT